MSVLYSLVISVCIAWRFYSLWLWLFAFFSHLRLLSLLSSSLIAILYDSHHALEFLEIYLVVAVLVCFFAYLLPCLIIGYHVRQSSGHHSSYFSYLDTASLLVFIQIKSRS